MPAAAQRLPPPCPPRKSHSAYQGARWPHVLHGTAQSPCAAMAEFLPQREASSLIPCTRLCQWLQRRTERCPSLQIRATEIGAQSITAERCLLPWLPKTKPPAAEQGGLCHGTSLAPARGTACSSAERTHPETSGLALSIPSPKGSRSPQPVPGAGKRLGQVPTASPWAGQHRWLPARQTNPGQDEEERASCAGFSAAHLMRLPCFISETNERCATLGGRDGASRGGAGCRADCTQRRASTQPERQHKPGGTDTQQEHAGGRCSPSSKPLNFDQPALPLAALSPSPSACLFPFALPDHLSAQLLVLFACQPSLFVSQVGWWWWGSRGRNKQLQPTEGTAQLQWFPPGSSVLFAFSFYLSSCSTAGTH